MWVDGKYMSEPEVAAYIDKLKAENSKMKKILKVALDESKTFSVCYTLDEENCKHCACDNCTTYYRDEIETLINDKSETNPNLEYTGSIT